MTNLISWCVGGNVDTSKMLILQEEDFKIRARIALYSKICLWNGMSSIVVDLKLQFFFPNKPKNKKSFKEIKKYIQLKLSPSFRTHLVFFFFRFFFVNILIIITFNLVLLFLSNNSCSFFYVLYLWF